MLTEMLSVAPRMRPCLDLPNIPVRKSVLGMGGGEPKILPTVVVFLTVEPKTSLPQSVPLMLSQNLETLEERRKAKKLRSAGLFCRSIVRFAVLAICELIGHLDTCVCGERREGGFMCVVVHA